jgi:hypothetical protein
MPGSVGLTFRLPTATGSSSVRLSRRGDGEATDVGETDRDLLRRQVTEEAEHLEQVRGHAVALGVLYGRHHGLPDASRGA